MGYVSKEGRELRADKEPDSLVSLLSLVGSGGRCRILPMTELATAAAADIVASHGKAKYDAKKGALVWKMRRLARVLRHRPPAATPETPPRPWQTTAGRWRLDG